MTLGTVESEVNTIESEVFVEITSDLPASFGVAACALIAELSLVNVLMAGQTLAANRFVANDRDCHFVFDDSLPCDRLVTLAALHVHVLMLKTIGALLVVIKSDGLPLVLVVTLKTISIELPLVNVTVTAQALLSL